MTDKVTQDKNVSKERPSLQELIHGVWIPILIFVVIDLVLTAIFFVYSPTSSHIGTLRPEATIAPKVLELALVGAGVGLVACLGLRSFDLNLVTLGVAFVVLLDLDHLPSIFGIDQPIRPAHSFVFLAILLVVLYLTMGRKGNAYLPTMAASAFFAHMSVDLGEFALYAPFSFNYVQLESLRVPIAIGALCLAGLAGYLKRQRKSIKVAPNITIDGKV